MQAPATFHVPIAFATTTFALPQEPKSASDTPAGGPAPAPAPGGTQAPGAPAPAGQPASQSPFDGMGMFFYIALIMIVLMLFTSRKESKARKEQAAMLASIKKGDRVVTTAGMHAVVERVEEKTLVLMLDSVAVTFERSAVARVLRDDASRTEAKRS